MVQIIKDLCTLGEFIAECQGSIGLVPSLGNYHAGHVSLFEKSVADNDVTIVSTVCLPIVFNDFADYEAYPKTPDADIHVVEKAGATVLFTPDQSDLCPSQYTYFISEPEFSRTLEGQDRPAHFDGALTVILKLLLLIQPDRIYLGEKDFQQLELVREMCKDFYLQTQVVACPIIREDDGLAYSSRNQKMSAEQRVKASHFPRLLSSKQTCEQISDQLRELGFNVHYIEDYGNRRLGAVELEKMRLIDNVEIYDE